MENIMVFLVVAILIILLMVPVCYATFLLFRYVLIIWDWQSKMMKRLEYRLFRGELQSLGNDGNHD